MPQTTRSSAVVSLSGDPPREVTEGGAYTGNSTASLSALWEAINAAHYELIALNRWQVLYVIIIIIIFNY